jgi:hypothetical protein
MRRFDRLANQPCIKFQFGARLIERDVLKPAAVCNGRPLFPAGPEAVAEAKATVAAFSKTSADQCRVSRILPVWPMKEFCAPGKFYPEKNRRAAARDRENFLDSDTAFSRVLSICKQSWPKAIKFLDSFARLPWRDKRASEEISKIDRVEIRNDIGVRFAYVAASVSSLRRADLCRRDGIGRWHFAAFKASKSRVNIAHSEAATNRNTVEGYAKKFEANRIRDFWPLRGLGGFAHLGEALQNT